MTKKAAEKDKQTSAKPKGNSDLVSSAAGSEVRSRGSKPMKLTDDPRFTQAVQNLSLIHISPEVSSRMERAGHPRQLRRGI